MTNNGGAGYEYPPQPVTWLKRDALLFANSIGATADELHFLYELHPKFQVFPTYPTILPFKKTTPEVIDFYAAKESAVVPGLPKLDVRRVLDGQRHLKFLKPLPPTSEGRKFELRNKITGVWDKGKPGTVMDTQANLVDAETGEVYTEIHGSAFYVGQGGWGGPKGPAAVNYPPPKDKAPDATFSDQTDAMTPILYRLNGDYNPLHIDPSIGEKMNFGGVIIHGLYSWNATAHGLLKALGGSDPANLKEYQCRFASPVIPGDKLTTSVWRMGKPDANGFEEVRFEVKNQKGKVVLSNGRAVMKVVGGDKAKL
ncbi:peroxisomal dehydratase [Cutaneotrichosporon oleaginosum]|uniref:Peroxisomal dehydratase n=1 Tax=Cutaneotrichosporon oleaginosum TaxID=879819 RepID=A0A0J0XJL1_9TREE|nr:peroxisomal dehydratase [Cutaneotrichosporon oleaginosum]KLT41295.1 peroxisomal dehydratase [Cutaneotrichosporon oleaginosum]TXT14045.1 hypothetical protein COLE_00238 [Cutaneotrichosporon oleaginosum]